METPITTVNYNPVKYDRKKDYDNWWTLKDHELAHSLWNSIKNINSLETRRRVNTRNALLYEDCYDNRELTGYPYDFGKVPSYHTRITYNVIKSVIDTARSKITKNKPKVKILTDGGNYMARERAKNLTKYINATFRNIDVYKDASLAFRDGCVYGTGAIKFFKDYTFKRIGCEKVLIDEIIVDDADGIYGNPKCLYQVKYVNKWVLLKKYPEYKDKIEQALPVMLPSIGETNLIPVAEGWRLPVGDDIGKHTICLENCTLFEEDYLDTFFPFVFIRWTEPLKGFFGTGIADELANIQKEIDRIFKNISKALHLVAVPRVFLPNTTGIDPQQITNEYGQIIKYTTTGSGDSRPFFFTPQALNAETYNHFKWLIQSAYEKTGISQLSAQSQKPAGLNAAVAIRTVQDIETERFYSIADNYQASFIEAAKILIPLSKSLDQELKEKGDSKGLFVKGVSQNEMEVINWKDCDLDEDRYVMEAWPVNMLPDRPEGRLQFISEMIQAGIIAPDKAPKLLPYPDITAEIENEYAETEYIDKTLDLILYKGIYQQPEPFMDLEYALKAGQQAFNKGRLEKVPEKNLMKVIQYIDDTERLLEKTAEQLAPEQPLPENQDPSLDMIGEGMPAPTLPNQIENQGLTEVVGEI